MMNLEDVSDILDSQRIPITASDRVEGPYPYYGANGIQDYVNDYIFDDELVLLAEDGGNFGSKERPIAYRVSGKCWVNNHAHVLKPKEFIDVDYLCYSLMFYDVTNIINGATRQKLNQAAMRKMQISVLPIEEQKKIAEILDKASNLIFLRKKQIEKLDLLVKAKFIDMFGDPFFNLNCFEVVPFEKCIDYIGDIGSNGANSTISAHLKMSDKEDYALMVRTLNFTANDFTKSVKYVSRKVYDFFKKSQIFGGELIFNKIGSAGINFIMPYLNRPVSLGLNQIVIRIKDNVNMTYLYALLNTEYGKYQINSRVQGAVTKSITKGEIKKIPILIPPTELQNQFSDFVKQVEKQKSVLKQGLEKLELTYKSLMQQYFG